MNPQIETLENLLNNACECGHQSCEDERAALTAAIADMERMETPGAREVLTERIRQITDEGWHALHDDDHNIGELADAAACYALGKEEVETETGDVVYLWPWPGEWWKPSSDPIRNLEKAGALILAEIARLKRAAMKGESK